jgi:hypothetical protein
MMQTGPYRRRPLVRPAKEFEVLEQAGQLGLLVRNLDVTAWTIFGGIKGGVTRLSREGYKRVPPLYTLLSLELSPN